MEPVHTMRDFDDNKVVSFPKYRMRKLLAIVDGYFMVKESQGILAAQDYVLRITPIQLRKAVAELINNRQRKTG